MSHTVKVLEVIEVNLTIYKTNPATLAIRAEGIVPRLGYRNGQLIPYVYIKFPTDGIWDFDFVADEPDTPSPTVLAPITADYLWPDYPKNLRGVRIHATNNKIEKEIKDHVTKSLTEEMVTAK
jgi:hypothetical protein